MGKLGFETDQIASKDDVAKATSKRIPKPVAWGAPEPRLLMLKAGVEAETEDGMMPDSAFDFKVLDDGNYNDKTSVESSGDRVPTRDSRGNLWTGTPIDNEDCANKQYVEDTVKYKMPKIENNQVPYATVPIVVANPDIEVDENGTYYPSDDSYGFMTVDDGLAGKYNTEEMRNAIATRDGNGNLWTGEPVDDQDCIGFKYANQHFMPIMVNDEYHPYVYIQPEQSEYPTVLGADRIDGYMQAQSEEGALPDGDLSEFGGFIARRQHSGNLLSGIPTTKHEVANKMYVDALRAEIDELRAMIEELKAQ